MKGAFFLALVSSVIGFAAANSIDKEQLCTEVCWTYNIGEHDDCTKRCIANARPTDDEAGKCQDCIEDCLKYMADYQSMVLYTECRSGCFAKYFPQIVNRSFSRSKSLKKKGLVPGVPNKIRDALGGKVYPVEKNICEMSCRNEGADSILGTEGTMKTCVEKCQASPTPRHQELQMALDCSEGCPSSMKNLDICYKECIFEHAKSRAPGVDFSAVTRSIDVLISGTTTIVEEFSTSTHYSAKVPTAAVTFPVTATIVLVPSKTSKASKVAKSTKTLEIILEKEEVDSFSVMESSTDTSFSGSAAPTETVTTLKKVLVVETGNAAGQNYFETWLFWVHAASTIVVATVLGLQLI